MSPVVASRRLTPFRVLSFLFANLVWLAPFFLAPVNAAAATDTFTVSVTTDPATGTAANCPANNPGGSGSCSLRDAIAAVNADTSNSAIVDMTGVTGTITLTSTASPTHPITTTNSVTFSGPGAGALTVSGNSLYQVFLVENGPATFQNFTIANGFVNATGGCGCDPGYGAGIYAYTTVNLTLTDMVITGNSAAKGGGGVLAASSITVTGSTFSNNSSPASGGGIAGGLYAIGSPATIYQSTFSGNTAWIGSAIDTYAPVTLTISDSTFANNQAGTNGASAGSGGVLNDNGSTLTIHDSTFWNNTAAAGEGGALNNAGTMTVTDSIVGNPGDSAGTQECYSNNAVNGTGCPSTGDGHGNITAPSTFNLSPLGYYGGVTETIVPLTASAALCGGTTAGALNVSGSPLTVDQRGLPLDASCGTGTTDAGSVQKNYPCAVSNPNPNPNPQSFAAVGDFNGDCMSDILWRNNSTDQVYIWLINGTTFAGGNSPGTPTSDWVIQATGDFNGDGYADILWRNTTTGEVFVWLMNGTTIANSGSLGFVSSDWSIAGVGDFNGDGKADILWQNSSGQIYLWFMNGTTMSGGGTVSNVSAGWNIQGVGDFNGDGKADILWRNSTTGQVYIWLMNGTSIASTGTPGSPTSDWSIAGVGDYDGNGKSDILWRNSTTGQVYIWFMNGTTTASSGSVAYVSSDWNIQGAGDYDGSGRAGILWRNSTSGVVYIWLMNGTTMTSSGSPGNPVAAWQIAP
ncbi:MAG: FG-GAP-like repeat-containing protein [Acidobacteriaceae bacterium]